MNEVLLVTCSRLLRGAYVNGTMKRARFASFYRCEIVLELLRMKSKPFQAMFCLNTDKPYLYITSLALDNRITMVGCCYRQTGGRRCLFPVLSLDVIS